MPVISVIVPFYNRIKFTLEAINSVLNQTFKDFELLLIDDGSVEDLKSFIDLSNDKIKYYRLSHKGISHTRNFGISVASGKYIAFLDSDDLFIPEKLELQYNLMVKNNIMFSHSSYYQINNCSKRTSFINSGKFSGHVYPDILWDCPIATTTVMIKADVIKSYKFEEDIDIGEDIILWTRLSKEYKLFGIEKPLSLIRFNKEGSTSQLPLKQLRGGLDIINYSMKYDKNLSKFFKIRKLSSVYLLISRLYFRTNKRISLIYFFKSLLIWPFNKRPLLITVKRFYKKFFINKKR